MSGRPVPTVARFVMFAIGLAGCLQVCRAQTAGEHAWRPPFGLDRVGHIRPEVAAGQIEADARAVALPSINPVDLGAILVPHDWLLIGPDQRVELHVAAISWGQPRPDGRLAAWFASAPDDARRTEVCLEADRVLRRTLTLEPPRSMGARDVLHVELRTAEDRPSWKKEIPVMRVPNPPTWPLFGAVRTKLRYDAPISVRESDGTFSTLDYETAWDATLDDVVVLLPSGGRFVFWRGSSYIPFWAGQRNTGLCYEWAETSPPPDGFTDCVEPLMDKTLRYGRVAIIESTESRVHVRWTYQSCDFTYRVWGDSAIEDYYFYPDGYGSRVLTILSALDGDYELSEFIVLTPQGAYPLSVLPPNLVDLIFLDGQRRELTFPFDTQRQDELLASRGMPVLYRVRMHKDDPQTAIYFHPTDVQLPPVVFAAFRDQGEVVTPCYWGSHWPLARGQTTGGAINERIHETPCHNSIMSWARQRPVPLHESLMPAIDTLGRAKPMRQQSWAWLIGLSSAADEQVLEQARSFAQLPSVTLSGAQLDFQPAAIERRAIRIVAQRPQVTIHLVPQPVTVNPVLEIRHSYSQLSSITLGSQPLPRQDWAWDGQTLWIKSTLRDPTEIKLHFAP